MTHHTRVKICGITSPQDAEAAVAFGADAIGLNFYPKSSRYVSIEKAIEISKSIGPFVTVVGLFVNAKANEIKTVLESVPIQLLQFHGDESAEFATQFALPYIKVIKVPRPGDASEAAISAVQQAVIQTAQAHPRAQGFLLDTLHEKEHGGTGIKFDWRCVPTTNHYQWTLAGGLNHENVGEAIATVLPYAVDVSSGVESEPGKKDSEKVKRFITASKSVNVKPLL